MKILNKYTWRITMIIILFGLQVACTPIVSSSYSISANNITSIRKLNKNIKLGEFSGLTSTVSCRGTSIAPPRGMTFAQYVKDSFNSELMIANTNFKDEVSISINITNIDVDCSVGTGFWLISSEVTVGDQLPIKIISETKFEGSFAEVKNLTCGKNSNFIQKLGYIENVLILELKPRKDMA